MRVMSRSHCRVCHVTRSLQCVLGHEATVARVMSRGRCSVLSRHELALACVMSRDQVLHRKCYRRRAVYNVAADEAAL